MKANTAQSKILYYIFYTIMFVLLTIPSAFAQNNSTKKHNKDKSPWAINLASGMIVAPEFEGSDKRKIRLGVLVEIEYMDRFFYSLNRGLGVYAVNNDEWMLSVAVNFNPGRKESASTLLKGMGDIDSGAVFSAYGEWTPGPFTFSLEASYGTDDVKGLNLTAGFGHSFALFKNLEWENVAKVTFADSKYNDTFFGISKKQSRESSHKYKYYKASSGIKDATFSSTLVYSLTDNIYILTQGEYKRLLGPAADSPLVKAGSKNQYTGIVSLGYKF